MLSCNSSGLNDRQNFRDSRSKAEAAGISFVSQVPLKAFQYGAWQLFQKHAEGAELGPLKRVARMLSQASDPLIMGLRSHAGDWLGLAAGWYERGRAVLILQINDDEEYPTISLGPVLRGYVMEHLIRYNVRDVVFCGKAGKALQELTTSLPAVGIHIDKPLPGWQLLRWGIRRAMKHLPPAIAAQAEWVATPKIAPAPIEC